MRFYNSSNKTFLGQQGLALVFLALLISLLSAYLAYSDNTQSLDWLHYDKAMNFSHLPSADDIVIVDIDDKSISKLGRWPWSRSRHAQLLDKLTKAQSKIVVFDVLFPELDVNHPEDDQRFANAIKRNGAVIMPIYLETLGQQGQVVESPPHALFYREIKALGHVHLHAETDGVVRSVFLKEGVGSAFWPHLSLAVFEQTHSNLDPQVIPGSRAENLPDMSVGIMRDFHNLLPMPSAKQGLRHYSYSDILIGAVDLTNLHDKIVFVGATSAGLGDVLATSVGSMNGVELNAWIYHALRHQKLIQTYPVFNLALITFFTVFVLLIMLGRLSPRSFLIFSVLSIAGLFFFSTLMLLSRQLWLPVSSTMIGISLFFPLWSWLRAESMLRFLRAEIEELSRANSHKAFASNRKKIAQDFLEQTGMIDSATHQETDIGKHAIQALYVTHGKQQGPQNFWQEQLEKLDASSANISKHKGVEVIARTISQLKIIQENDLKNRQLIEKSLSRLQDAVCIVDLCGEITFANRRFQRWIQKDASFSSDSSSNGHDTLLDCLNRLELKSGKTWAQVLSSLYQHNKLFSDEAILRTKNEMQFLCQASLVSINETYNDTLIFTFTNITQLKLAENARAEALSFLSHDLRSPMVSVLAILDRYHTESSKTESGKNSRTLSQDSITHIESLVRKNLDYAESFLQLSKADALLETNMSPCDLHAVLDSAQVQAYALAAPKSIQVLTDRCTEDVWVLGDISLLERALNNLISNAIKFSPNGSQLSLSLKKLGNEAQLTVKDQGSGIDKQDQGRIFKRFTRLKNTQSTEGAGLGLNFVTTVAKKHKGHISLKSELNVGSTFVIHLPALSEDELFKYDE